MRRLLLLLATTLATLGAGLVAATPAQAATPTCTSWTTYGPPVVDYEFVHFPSAGYQSGRLDCILKYGNRNDAVKVLQRALRYCHDRAYVEIDGDYGALTRLAVYSVQIDANRYLVNKIAEDGEFGPQTRREMGFPVVLPPNNQMAAYCHSSPW